MNIYFSGIGGVGLGPLAEIAHDAGHQVQGSDAGESLTTKQLADRGIAVNNKQNGKFLQACHGAKPIDWFVYTSALPDNHPELVLARLLNLKITKRDELLAYIIQEKNLKLIAVAGTHGKTTTTSMFVWTMKQLGIPISYSIGSTVGFGPSGEYVAGSEYFIYECDEFDRNFLHFHPFLSVITSLDYDHSDTYGSPEEYMAAFQQFLQQSGGSVLWKGDGLVLDAHDSWKLEDSDIIDVAIVGEHNRKNATLVAKAIERLEIKDDTTAALNAFPGVDRRFEAVRPHLYSDYGHHPIEIEATLQLASELNEHVVLVYQPHQNVRQHEIRNQYVECFDAASEVYWLPTYLTRENTSLPILTPEELIENIYDPSNVHIADMNLDLWEVIQKSLDAGKLVLVMGAGSVDAWLRQMCAVPQTLNILVTDQEGSFLMKKQATSESMIVTSFSGPRTDDDTSLISGAERTLRQQAPALTFDQTDLAYFKTYPHSVEVHGEERFVTYYALSNVDAKPSLAASVELTSVNPNALRDNPLSMQERTVIAEYTHPTM